MHHRYHINLFWSDEDECWIADVPDLTCCSAHGPTPEAALVEVETAISAWLAVQSEPGRPAPEPRYRPTICAARDAAQPLIS
jgi:predicted RNase H-like HicB family nuclease